LPIGNGVKIQLDADSRMKPSVTVNTEGRIAAERLKLNGDANR
jgi:hypothetical protein